MIKIVLKQPDLAVAPGCSPPSSELWSNRSILYRHFCRLLRTARRSRIPAKPPGLQHPEGSILSNGTPPHAL
jgi:hypothetical protein